MKSLIKYYFLNILLLFILIIIWYFSCFLSGYTSNNQKHLFKIWILYSITTLLYFILSWAILKRKFKDLSIFHSLVNFLLYILVTIYLYHNT